MRRSVCKNYKIQVERDCDGCECMHLKQEIAGLKESLRNYEIARQLVESNVKVINGRYEIPFPLKMDVVTKFAG